MALAPIAAGLSIPAFGQTLPHPADELQITTLLGSKIDLKQFRGKVCAVELLLTWCSHCQASGGVLEQLWSELKPKGFEVVGAATNVDANTAKEEIGKFLGASGAKFPVGWVTQADTYRFLHAPVTKLLSFPQLLLVDRKGNVVYQHEGEVDINTLRAEIMKYLAPAAGGAAAPKKLTGSPTKKS